jgi:hypothetical protein
MTTIEAVRYVKENGCCLMRARKGTANAWDVKPGMMGKKHGWFYMDIMTASMLVSVYEALKPDHQAKFNLIPLMKLINLGWSATKAA